MSSIQDNLIREPVGRIMGKISRRFLAIIHENLSHLDIDRSFYPLLLIEAGNGNLTQKELAKELLCDEVQVVRIIDYLSSNDYVERILNTNDRRKYNLKITEKAKRLLPDIKKALYETNLLALKDVPDNKVDEFYALLNLIDKNLSSLKVDL